VQLRLHEITIDCLSPALVGGFWSALLDAPLRDEPLPGWLRLGPLTEDGPLINFQPVPEGKQGKNRLHLDVLTDDLPAAIARVQALGGEDRAEKHVYDVGTVVVMADPEGNELCLVAGNPPPA
jgi:predicted enzyme related to lactoylglutathione lyase